MRSFQSPRNSSSQCFPLKCHFTSCLSTQHPPMLSSSISHTLQRGYWGKSTPRGMQISHFRGGDGNMPNHKEFAKSRPTFYCSSGPQAWKPVRITWKLLLHPKSRASKSVWGGTRLSLMNAPRGWAVQQGVRTKDLSSPVSHSTWLMHLAFHSLC